MREIKEIAELINDEVDGVTEYAKLAVYYKDARPQLAALYNQLANTEYQHVQKLHAMAAELVKEAESKGTEYPQAMKDKWDMEHKESVGKMAVAKTFMGMYK